jgi:hypothetical protein
MTIDLEFSLQASLDGMRKDIKDLTRQLIEQQRAEENIPDHLRFANQASVNADNSAVILHGGPEIGHAWDITRWFACPGVTLPLGSANGAAYLVIAGSLGNLSAMHGQTAPSALGQSISNAVAYNPTTPYFDTIGWGQIVVMPNENVYTLWTGITGTTTVMATISIIDRTLSSALALPRGIIGP